MSGLHHWEPAEQELAALYKPCQRCLAFFGFSTTQLVDGVPTHVCLQLMDVVPKEKR